MNAGQQPLNALSQGYRLEEYELLRVLGVGGFGITYLGFDHNLDKGVAIKEYLPSDIATRTRDHSVAPQASDFQEDFEWGLDRFLDEARTLARFQHPNIVQVYRFFEAHGTGYIVMEYVEGETLSAYLERKETLTESELKSILYPILDGLEIVHGANFLHRDIKPNNIIIRDEDDSPVLLDFGAARQAMGTRSRSVASMLTPGYAPIERYSSQGNQGPWTDIYSLGVVCYRALTGQMVHEAMDRIRDDPLIPLSEQYAGRASHAFLSAIDHALSVYEKERPQSVSAWRTELGGRIESAETIRMPPPRHEPPRRAEPEQQKPSETKPPGGKPRRVWPRVLLGLCVFLFAGIFVYRVYQWQLERQDEIGRQAGKERRDEEKPQAEEKPQNERARPSEPEAKISALLSGAKADLSANRLTSPAGNNAWEKYQAVLKLAPGHREAQAGLDNVIARYKSMFDSALSRKKFAEAERYMSQIRSIHANAPGLLEMENRLSASRAAEKRRQEAQREKLNQIRQAAAEAERQRQEQMAAEREAERSREQQAGRKFRDCEDCPEMVVVPAGAFTMGSPGEESGRYADEGPRHHVKIWYPFAVGLYEVTFGEWDACVGDGGCGGYVPDDKGWGRGNRPVINVSWNDAQAYVQWLSNKTGAEYHLLSESEWEYVARAGTSTARYWGESSDAQCRYANGADETARRYHSNLPVEACDDGHYHTALVGTYTANAFGLYDVLGNVWEWTQDCWIDNYSNISGDGSARESGDCSKRVFRGGSWSSGPLFLRSAYRIGDTSELRDSGIGFRVARSF